MRSNNLPITTTLLETVSFVIIMVALIPAIVVLGDILGAVHDWVNFNIIRHVWIFFHPQYWVNAPDWLRDFGYHTPWAGWLP